MSSKFDYIKIRLASPEEILGWSYGEVKKHETINYRTLKPEPDGLFCERIFGPMKDYQCSCGKKRSGDRGGKCEKCGVEITEAKVRRERMGHITLASPVVHTWYLKNSPSRLAILLDLKAKELEEVVYLASYIVVDSGTSDVPKKTILNEHEYYRYLEKYGSTFKALTGGEAVKKLLQEVDLEKERNQLRKQLNTSSKQKRDKIIKRLEVVESLYFSDNKPEWMILDVLPVIPPDLRPMVQLDGGRFATTDLNDLYRRILNRNNRLKAQFEKNAPHLITKNEKRMLQEAVDALIDNSKRVKKQQNDRSNNLKSLSDMLRGKQGRFRQNLLGKRVDYSGRSVIVVGPDLKMYECGIPRAMAVTLFKPFIMRQLIDQDNVSISSAKTSIEKLTPRVWEILEQVAKEHPVLLNRAPTLHRLGIQAFEPKLIDGKAIRLHPLVTTAFNADFDGDQMAVHLPLSPEAQAEARLLMLASNNILNPKDGKPVVTPSQDMVLGNYYLTMEKVGLPNEGHFYTNFEEAYIAYKNKAIELHTRIFLEAKSISTTKFTTNQLDKYILTTLGKMIFNNVLPSEVPYLNEPNPLNIEVTGDWNFIEKGLPYEKYLDFMIKPKYDPNLSKVPDEVAYKPFNKKFLSLIISHIFKKYHINETSKILDYLKDLGFEYSTISGITISANDVITLDEKVDLIEASDKKVELINEYHNLGLLTDLERKKLITAEWTKTRDTIQEQLWNKLIKNKENHIFMMADSGARGSTSNFSQLAGMRGLMNNTSGQVIEVPVKANFLEGLTVSEFFISTHGARKGSTDTALKTAESGYLTRRLVDVSQDVIIKEEDCGTERTFLMEDLKDDDGKVKVELYDRIIGRYSGKDIFNKKGDLIIKRNVYITNEIAREIIDAGITGVEIRSNLTCDSKFGVCMKCYGRNLATNNLVEVGEAVGTIAAQSIGEPGTQLTMRTFHTGGVASTADITQGLPRIQELFEARTPKGKSTLSEVNGIIDKIDVKKNGIRISIKAISASNSEFKDYELEPNAELLVSVGDAVSQGDKLNKGSIAPKELLRLTNATQTQKYLIEEVQKVYCGQGVEISDKHIEIIVRQMMQKVSVITQGDTNLLPSMDISMHDFKEANKTILFDNLENNQNKELAVGKPVLLGITRAALKSDSFLSACSFQETTRVLTDAAIKGKIDPLHGLKENVIVGGLIPAGTGILEEDSFEYEKDEDDFDDPDDLSFENDINYEDDLNFVDEEYIKNANFTL